MGVVVNSGNANAATGPQGVADNASLASAAAAILGCPDDDVLVCSTGVIGVPLPMGRLIPAVVAATHATTTTPCTGGAAAKAICTTDTTEKRAWCTNGGVTVGGMAKGSGMIHPGMATMLGFLGTDAAVDPVDLQQLLATACDQSFHQISVDGDQSTNDTVLLLATGDGPPLQPGSRAWRDLEEAVVAVARDLARQIAADGEGARTLLTVRVSGGPTDAAARMWARTVASSSLVKAAVHGQDPNWGRVVGALGQAGALALDSLDLDLAGVAVMRAGMPVAFDEEPVSVALGEAEVVFDIHLPGSGRGEAWGCDLSAAYVSINADYRS
jgi:glutamate N-acetyltransferase/amino-acid N-acetyltransferase